MLTKEMNERLTRVGPGTPMGELLRRYWYPVATVPELDAERVKARCRARHRLPDPVRPAGTERQLRG